MVKRKRSRSKTKRYYFNEDTQAAIVRYQESDALSERETIYVAEILPAFEKLVENLICIHGFVGLHSTFEGLRHDCIAFLFESLGKYDPTRGTKAFSYFNVIAKNFLIVKSKQRAKSQKRYVSMDDHDQLHSIDLQLIESHDVVPDHDEVMIDRERIARIQDLLAEIKNRLQRPNDHLAIDAVMAVFESVDQLDLLKKRAVYLYLQELSGLNAKQLASSLSIIRQHYRDLRSDDDVGLF